MSSQIESVIAGTDLANTASLAMMRRLGMRFHKDVQYPLGAGVEYVIYWDDVGPLPNLITCPFFQIIAACNLQFRYCYAWRKRAGESTAAPGAVRAVLAALAKRKPCVVVFSGPLIRLLSFPAANAA